MECRVKPLCERQTSLLKAFDEYFNDVIGLVMALTPEVIDKATELRAEYNFKTPDSIHLAAAIIGKCDVFLTNDYRLKKCQAIDIEIIG